MYPLQENYAEAILKFLNALHKKESLTIRVNALSTQVQGEWDDVFTAVKAGITQFFEADQRGSFVMKLLPGNIALDYQYKDQ